MVSSENSNKVHAIMIIEVLGKPKEHLVEALKGIISKMKEEKGVEILENKIHEPKELEKRKGFFSTFAEIEIETESAIHIAGLMFRYMPSHVDILSPEKITLTNNDYGDLLSEITRKLHKVEEIVKVLQMENQIMKKKLEKK
jgi:hypothetical protein